MTEHDRLGELLADTTALLAPGGTPTDSERGLAEAHLLRASLCCLAGEVADRALADDAEGAVSELDELIAALESAADRLLRVPA